MKKYRLSKLFVILSVSIWAFSACNESLKKENHVQNTVKDRKNLLADSIYTENHNNIIVVEDSLEAMLQMEKSNLKRAELKAAGINSYFYRDTLYLFNEANSFIAKHYFKPLENDPNFNKIIETLYGLEQTSKEAYLYISLYIGDATPYKSYLIDKQTHQILIENEDFQTYVGSSANNNYHLFETGTAAGMRTFAIFNSANELLKREDYYTVNDTNQLKWAGNKFYYYKDCRQGVILPDHLPGLKEQEIYVQKYFWTNEVDSVTNEFAVAFVE